MKPKEEEEDADDDNNNYNEEEEDFFFAKMLKMIKYTSLPNLVGLAQ